MSCAINMNYCTVFLIFSCSHIPQLNHKFKNVVVSPHHMTLLVQIMLIIVGKSFFHTNKCKCMSLNVRIEVPICERNGHVFPFSISNPHLF